MHLKLVMALFFILSTAACTSMEKNSLGFKPKLSPSEYSKLIKDNTFNKKEYKGFYNQFDVSVTFLTTEVFSANLERMRYYLQWDEVKYQQKREEMFQTLSNSSKVFLSFYTPEPDLRNPQRPDSLWEVYLEVDGQRYEGEIKSHNEAHYLLKELYPHHTRWSNGYMISFNIPMSVVESQNSKLVLTSPAGKAIFNKSPNK